MSMTKQVSGIKVEGNDSDVSAEERESGVHRIGAPLQALIDRAKADDVQGIIDVLANISGTIDEAKKEIAAEKAAKETKLDLSAAQGVVDMLDGVRRTSRTAILAVVDARQLTRTGCGGTEDVERAFEALSELRDLSKLAKRYAREAHAERREMQARITDLETALAAALKNASEFDEVRAQLAKVTSELASLRSNADATRKVVSLPTAARRSRK